MIWRAAWIALFWQGWSLSISFPRKRQLKWPTSSHTDWSRKHTDSKARNREDDRCRSTDGGIYRMSLYCAVGSIQTDLSPEQLQELLSHSLAQVGKRNRVLVVPPDQSRIHSRAGDLTRYAWEYYGDQLHAVLPALGTHAHMRPEQIERMFG